MNLDFKTKKLDCWKFAVLCLGREEQWRGKKKIFIYWSLILFHAGHLYHIMKIFALGSCAAGIPHGGAVGQAALCRGPQ